MVDLTRRKTVIGLGLLATGSGATFTSAAFQSSTTPDSDLRVLVEQNLQFGANPDLPDEDYYTDNPDFFNDDGTLDESGDGAFENNGDDPSTGEDGGNTDEDGDGRDEGFERSTPLAFVDGANGELTVKAVVDIGTSHRFERMFQLQNNTTDPVDIGIAYDRNNIGTGPDDGNNGQYGVDIGLNQGDALRPQEAQRIYQFELNNGASVTPDTGAGLISPAPGEEGEAGGLAADDNGPNIEIKNSFDRPDNQVTVPAGGSVELDLVVDTAADEDRIREAADIDPTQFGFQTDTVQIMEEITVVSQPESESES